MNVDGNAVIFCESSFDSTYGKTAHGLVRFTERYRVCSVIDSTNAGQDALQFLDGKESGIPIVTSLEDAFSDAAKRGITLTHFVVGIATDGGFLDQKTKDAVSRALKSGLNVDSGLHDFLSDIGEFKTKAEQSGLAIRDIRKQNDKKMHAFTGRIEEVGSSRIAILGTDSANGKRTTAWILVHALRNAGSSCQLIGTGQTAWMQGAKHGIILDSLLNDYISGELENAILNAWEEYKMDFAVIEGQGSLMNPGYPGGFEILAAGRPHGIIMQHAPGRKEYDGFPGYAMDSINDQIHIAEFLSKKPVIAVTLNHEGLKRSEIDQACRDLEKECGRPVVDPLIHGMDSLIPIIKGLKL